MASDVGISQGSSAWGRAALQASRVFRVERANAWRVALLFAIGGLAGFLLVPARAAEREARATLDGQAFAVTRGAEGARAEIERIARAYVRGKITLRGGGASWERTRAELGARVDAERVMALAQALRDPSSPLRRGAKGGSEVRLPMPVRVDAATGVTALLPIKDDVDRGAANARIDIASGKAVAEEAGRRVDVYATLARIDDAIARGDAQVDLAIESIAAGHAIAQLEGAKVDAVLGSYETKVEPQRSTKALRAAAAKVNGAALLPGETFDFNEVVGSIHADGEGAGESQIASTLHAAAFFAGLAIVERHARPRPSSAMPMGLEALVVHPSVTLRIKNTMPWPIVFVETVTDSAVRAEVRGAARTREVTFARRIDATTPFAERELADAKVPRGVRFLAQRGVPGYAITRDRIVREGASSVRERDEDRYPPTPQLWRVGTGEPDPKFKPPRHEDEPPVEHAQGAQNEYVVITQGP